MGTAASTVREELQKPLDGSDLETLSDARSEVARLRSELHRSEAAATNAGAGAAAAAPAEKAAQTHSSLIMRLYAERGARSGSAVDFETLRARWGFLESDTLAAILTPWCRLCFLSRRSRTAPTAASSRSCFRC